MIYRILASRLQPAWDDTNRRWVQIPGGRLAGAFMAGLEGFNLNAPKIKNARARFYFTEKGWEKVGKAIVARARVQGHVVRVIRRKNPEKSQIVYADELQVAILPRKGLRPKT